MSDATVSPAVNEDEAALATPFVKCLVRLIRAQDSYGSWERKSDAEQLANFIATSSIAVRCFSWAIPSSTCWEARPVLHSVGLAVEKRSGL
ncbi:hypothetical protein [Mesorhizobium sp. M0619]|uniref:hypothetical protein n=1 Tax=unclassified Mesorhizobium TaxID=325217 RepID=UPI003335A960